MEKCITPISLGLSSKVHTHKQMHSQTFTLTKKGAVFKEPGATTASLLCETFIIYDVFDVVICLNIRGILIRLKQLKKKLCEEFFSLFKELFLPKEKTAKWSVDSSNTTFHWEKKKVISSFVFLYLIDLGAGVLQRLFNGPTSGCAAMPNTISKWKHFHWSMSLQSIQIKIDNGLKS